MVELDKYKKDNPNFRQIITPIMSIRGLPVQVDSGFRDVLKKIKSDYPGSTVNIPSAKSKFH
jgi:hypothetical protein